MELLKNRPDRFDLVISDMTMPNLTGDKLAWKIMDIQPDMPVILCSGLSEQNSEESTKSLGIREFILKPLVMDKLATTVRAVLDGRLRNPNSDPK